MQWELIKFKNLFAENWRWNVEIFVAWPFERISLLVDFQLERIFVMYSKVDF